MKRSLNQKDLSFEYLQVASDKIDPYISSIRESIPKVGENEDHLSIDLRRNRWKVGLRLLKEWFGISRFLITTVAVGIISWLFKMDLILGFCFLTAAMLFLIIWIIYYSLGIITLNDMQDERNKDLFHFRAYAKYRREYEIFSPFLTNGISFKFKQAFELLKEWEKDFKKKDEMIIKLERDLKELANESVSLPQEAQKEVEFVTLISDKILQKIRLKAEGRLSYSGMEFLGHYAIYRHEEDKSRLLLEYCSRPMKGIKKVIGLDDDKYGNKSYVKLVDSQEYWEKDDITISTVAEMNGQHYIYTIFFSHQNKVFLNAEDDFGKMNLDRLYEVITTAFKLFGYNMGKSKRG